MRSAGSIPATSHLVFLPNGGRVETEMSPPVLGRVDALWPCAPKWNVGPRTGEEEWGTRPVWCLHRGTLPRENGVTMKCQKCGSNLSKCQACDGGTKKSFLGDKLSCKACNNTGAVCPKDGGHWKK